MLLSYRLNVAQVALPGRNCDNVTFIQSECCPGSSWGGGTMTMLSAYRACGINKLSLRAHGTKRLMPVQTHERPSNKGRNESRQLFLSVLSPVELLPVDLLHTVSIRNERKSSSQSLKQEDTSQWLPLLSIIFVSKKPVSLKKPAVIFATQSLIQDRAILVWLSYSKG